MPSAIENKADFLGGENRRGRTVRFCENRKLNTIIRVGVSVTIQL